MKKVTSIIKNGGVAVIKTDTLYGIVGLAKNQNVVNRIYKIKNRNILKPVVVLVDNISDIKKLGVIISDKKRKVLKKYWPGKISIILPTKDSVNLHYLHKGTGGIAFRIPDNNDLRNLLNKTGPLVAPSANPEGKSPARNIKEAMEYFGDNVDYYKDDGECENCKASKIISFIDDKKIKIIRK